MHWVKMWRKEAVGGSQMVRTHLLYWQSDWEMVLCIVGKEKDWMDCVPQTGPRLQERHDSTPHPHPPPRFHIQLLNWGAETGRENRIFQDKTADKGVGHIKSCGRL